MDEFPAIVDDAADTLPRGLYGYRMRTLEHYIRQLQRNEDAESRSWSNEVQRLTIETARNTERQKTLEDLASHMRLECERLKLQLEREKINSRLAEHGVREELRRLESEYRDRMKVIQSTQSRVQAEAEAYEKQLWQLSESLTRVLQDSQTAAMKQLSNETPDGVWQDFCHTVLGHSAPSEPVESLAHGLLIRYAVPQRTIRISARQGEDVGFLSALLMGTVPMGIIGYVVEELGVIPADDVRVLRPHHIMVQSQYELVPEDLVVDSYARMPFAPDTGTVPPPAPHDPSRNPIGPLVDTRDELPYENPSEPASHPEDLLVAAEDANPDITMDPAPVEDERLEARAVPEPAGALPADDTAAADAETRSAPSNEEPDISVAQIPLEPEAAAGHTTPAPVDVPTDHLIGEVPLRISAPETAPPPTQTPPMSRTAEVSLAPETVEAPDLDIEDSEEVLDGPSWHHQLADPHREDTALTLPGIAEASPPHLDPVRRVSRAQAAVEDDPLPGIVDSVEALPSPSWADEAPVGSRSSERFMPPATVERPPARTPEIRGSQAQSPSLEESGALDVRTFLYGKRVGQDIVDTHGKTIARAGDVITPDMVERIEQAGYLPDLIVHMIF